MIFPTHLGDFKDKIIAIIPAARPAAYQLSTKHLGVRIGPEADQLQWVDVALKMQSTARGLFVISPLGRLPPPSGTTAWSPASPGILGI
jgi:hypothetical protein